MQGAGEPNGSDECTRFDCAHELQLVGKQIRLDHWRGYRIPLFDLADQPHAPTQDTYTPGVSWVVLVAF